MRILGIDPGTATIGFGVIDVVENHPRVKDYGHIATSKTLSLPRRLNEIAHDLNILCKKWQPTVCAVEQLFFNKNVTSALQVAHARGVILQTLNHAGYPVYEYNPVQIKVALTGDGRAVKAQMKKMVTLLLNLNTPPHPDDAADALAVALCHAHSPLQTLLQ